MGPGTVLQRAAGRGASPPRPVPFRRPWALWRLPGPAFARALEAS